MPVGNERSPTFNTSISLHQLMESVNTDRMVVVYRQNNSMARNKEIGDEEAKKEIEGILACMTPIGGATSIAVFAPPKEDQEAYVHGNVVFIYLFIYFPLF